MYDTEECPYCEAQIKLDHDDGYGFEEDEIYQQECPECGKTFIYTVYISYNYTLEKAACLNEGGVHDYQETKTYPRVCARMQCTMCGDEQPLPKEKYEEYRKEYEERLEKLNKEA